MTVRFYDISRPLKAGIAVWPSDTPFECRPTGRRERGDSVNLSTLILSAHTGSHADAPYHFSNDGPTIETIDPAVYWGPAQVVTVNKPSGPLFPEDFGDYDLARAPRLLVHSPASAADPRVFHHDFVYPSPELADYLGAHDIRLYGTDAPSMDAAESRTLPGHNALLRNGIMILEGLDFSGVPDGLYELAALPLRITGGDGSPVRAILRTIQ